MKEKMISWGLLGTLEFDGDIIKQYEIDAFEDEIGGSLTKLELIEVEAYRTYIDKSLSISECLERRVANISPYSTAIYLGRENEYADLMSKTDKLRVQGDEFTKIMVMCALLWERATQVDRYFLIKNGESTTIFL